MPSNRNGCGTGALRLILLGVALIVSVTASALAQTSVVLTDTSQTTTLTAAVAEQADVSFPASVSFRVNDVNASTSVTNQVVTISNIVLATATKQVRVSLQGNAATFSAPAGASTTWDVANVSWSFTGDGSGWTNGTGSAGTLSSSAYNTVATCAAGVTSCSTDRLKFTLGPKATITRSGSYSPTITWKVESIGM